MSSRLKQELKAWEAHFRDTHGRDPTKHDIKQDIEITRKYKDYSNLKKTLSTANHNVLRTPTKQRSSRPQPMSGVSQAQTTNNSSLEASDRTLTSSSAVSKQNDATKSGGTARFVLANSPSKVRALAAMHSTSGSPNHRTALTADTKEAVDASLKSVRTSTISYVTSSRTSSTRPVLPVADFDRSPRKALNPFASPKKKELVTIQPPSRGTTLFGDFEKLEREKLRKKSRTKVTSGRGWGHASQNSESTVHTDVNKMEVDEVDEFFGAGGAINSKKARGSTKVAHSPGGISTIFSSMPVTQASATLLPSSRPEMRQGDSEDDEAMLGPSPVKGASKSRSSSFGVDQLRAFKPIFDVPPPVVPPAQRTESPNAKARPKLFATSLRTESLDSEDSLQRGTKRLIGKSNGTLDRKGSEVDDHGAVDGASFYGDAAIDVEKEVSKRKRAAAASGRRAGGKTNRQTLGREGHNLIALDSQDGDGPINDEFRVERDDRGGLILDFRIDSHQTDGDEEVRSRVFVHQQGRARSLWRDVGVKQSDLDDGQQQSQEEETVLDEISLLERPKPRSFLSSQSNAPEQGSHTSARSQHSSLPPEFASMLSLRASPKKSSLSAKDRQVAKLLAEPTTIAGRRRRGGLLDLEDELAEEDGDETAGRRDDGDDNDEDEDWEEEDDGWKRTGEAMDGYFSGNDDW